MWLPVGLTSKRISFMIFDVSTGAASPATGLTASGYLRCQISQNSGTFAAATNSVTEMEGGWYYIDLATAELDNTGPLSIRCFYSTDGTWGNRNTDYHPWYERIDLIDISFLVDSNVEVYAQLNSDEWKRGADYFLRRPLETAINSTETGIDAESPLTLAGAAGTLVFKRRGSGSGYDYYLPSDSVNVKWVATINGLISGTSIPNDVGAITDAP